MNRVIAALIALAALGGGIYWLATRSEPPTSAPSEADSPELSSSSPREAARPAVPSRTLEPSPGASPPPIPAEPSAAEPPPGTPGIDYAPSQAATAYWGRILPPGSFLRRKPKPTADIYLPLVAGAIVEVLQGEPTPFESPSGDGGREHMVPSRHAGQAGWVQESHIEKLDARPDDPGPLWKRLSAAVGAADTETCVPAEARAELHPSPGLERVVYSITEGACRFQLGVFADGASADAALLGWAKTNFLHHIETKAYAGRPDFLLTDEQWQRSPTDTGTSVRVLAVPDSPGPLRILFEANQSRIESTVPPGFYEMSSFSYPDLSGDGQWLIQWRFTKRRFVDGVESDESFEKVLAFDGMRFSEIPPPNGLAPLPPPPPSVRHGSPDDPQPDLKGYP